MKIIDIFEKSTTELLPTDLELNFIDALYDNHVVTTDVITVPIGFITPTGWVIDTSNIDDHGEAILYVFDVAGIKRNLKVWNQRYVDYIVEHFGLVRFRQDFMKFVDLPSKILKKQFNIILQLAKNSLDDQEEFTVSSALSHGLIKEFDPATSKETDILREVKLLTKVE